VVFKLLLWPVEQTRFARNLGRDIDSFSDRHPWIIYALALPLALAWPAVGVLSLVTHRHPAFDDPHEAKGYFTYFAFAPLMIAISCGAAGWITKEWVGPTVIGALLGVVAPVIAALYIVGAL